MSRVVAEPNQQKSRGASASGASLIVNALEVRTMLGLADRTFYQLRAKGKLPPTVTGLGNSTLVWRRSDIELFVECDCDRERFDAAIAKRASKAK